MQATMTDTPPPKRPRGRPKGSKGGGRPPTGRTERMTIRVRPGTRAKFDTACKSLGITLAEAVERAAEKILKEINHNP